MSEIHCVLNQLLKPGNHLLILCRFTCHTMSQNIRCYACGDRGHKEIPCVSTNPRNTFSGRLRYAQPTFELVVRDVEQVMVRDRMGDEFEVRAFGLMVTNDSLRIVKDADRIAFFGTPTRDREFLVMLANEAGEIRVTWSDQRVAIDTRFIATNNSLQTLVSPAPVPPADYDFSIRCVGRKVDNIALNLFVGAEVNAYVIHVDDRGQIGVAPVFIANQLRKWERDETLRTAEANLEAVGGVVDQLIEQAVVDVAAMNLQEPEGDGNE